MPRRWSKQIRPWVVRFLIARDGEKCAICKRTPPDATLEIDHVDGEPANNDQANLRLLCSSCNRSEGNKSRSGRLGEMRAQDQAARGNGSGPSDPGQTDRRTDRMPAAMLDQSRTRALRDRIDFDSPSAAIAINARAEPMFREWLLARLDREGKVPKADAVNAGAECAGVSTQTIREYLNKLTSSIGPIEESPTKDGRFLRLRTRHGGQAG